jgi:ATP-binding cassette subfamily B multidrug efflux pump
MDERMNQKRKKLNPRKPLQRIISYLFPHWLKITFIFIILLVETALKLLTPWMFGKIVNMLWNLTGGTSTPEQVLGDIFINIAFLLLSYIGASMCQSAVAWAVSHIGNNVLYELRKTLFAKIQNSPLRFFNSWSSGEIMSRLMNDTASINNVLNSVITKFFRNLFFLSGIVIAMYMLHLQLAAITSSVLILMVVSTVFFTGRIRKAFRRTRETISAINSELVEDISGVKVSQAFNRQERNIKNFKPVNKNNRDASIGVSSLYSFIYPLYNLINYLGIAVVLAYGGYLYIGGLISVGLIVTFLQYIDKFFYPISTLSSNWFDVQSGIATGDHMFEILDKRAVVQEPVSPVPINGLQGKVEFRSVYFEYIENQPVLRNISFTAMPGQTIAIVGHTGAGKTTMLSLIARLYDVTEGAILIDDHNVRDLSGEWLHTQTGIVLQDSLLFSETIMDNIRYGRLNATDQEVMEAARKVNAHDFISRLPAGYQTVMKEGGSNLSRGQRQIISIARAILADPRILILDEATSSVDTKTEILIQEAIERLLQNRTSFIVAHKLSTIKKADCILVIKNGSIIERGTHQELLHKQDEYYTIYNSFL